MTQNKPWEDFVRRFITETRKQNHKCNLSRYQTVSIPLPRPTTTPDTRLCPSLTRAPPPPLEALSTLQPTRAVRCSCKWGESQAPAFDRIRQAQTDLARKSPAYCSCLIATFSNLVRCPSQSSSDSVLAANGFGCLRVGNTCVKPARGCSLKGWLFIYFCLWSA